MGRGLLPTIAALLAGAGIVGVGGLGSGQESKEDKADAAAKDPTFWKGEAPVRARKDSAFVGERAKGAELPRLKACESSGAPGALRFAVDDLGASSAKAFAVTVTYALKGGHARWFNARLDLTLNRGRKTEATPGARAGAGSIRGRISRADVIAEGELTARINMVLQAECGAFRTGANGAPGVTAAGPEFRIVSIAIDPA